MTAATRVGDEPDAESTPRMTRPAPPPIVVAGGVSPHQLRLFELVPAGAGIMGAWFVPATDELGPMVVLTWTRGGEGEPYVQQEGLGVWHYTARTDGGGAWRVGYVLLRRPSDISDVAVHLGDVTGDGHKDVVFVVDLGGTAGCGPWRVVSRHGGGVREVFHRYICEGGIRIARGELLIERPVYRKDCPGVHGCRDRHRRIIARWNGSEFEIVSRGVAPGAPRPNF